MNHNVGYKNTTLENGTLSAGDDKKSPRGRRSNPSQMANCAKVGTLSAGDDKKSPCGRRSNPSQTADIAKVGTLSAREDKKKSPLLAANDWL
ncbi:MAG: hypothetical protein KIG72_07925 [Bradymonadales bacterium]|nr:hypothetical protein [Bradymonadales bacterium]